MYEISKMIDDLGLIKTQIAALKEQEATIRDQLILEGIKKAEGNLFRVSICTSTQRRLDAALIRKLVPKALLHRAEKEVPFTVVRVTIRKSTIPAKTY